MSTDQSSDPRVQEIRAAITAADREILAAANRRLELVMRLHAYKTEQGYAIVDPRREEELLRDLAACNGGPLSPEGVRELFTTLIAIGTREAAAQRQRAAEGAPTSPRRSPRD